MLGLTIVYVTHDQDEAVTMSSRIAVFNNGCIEQVDTPEVLYHSPATPFVASFVGENNLVRGVVREVAGQGAAARTRVETEGGLSFWVGGTPASPARDVAVSLRPEFVHVSAPADLDNTAEGRVDQITFRGDHLLCSVALDGSESLLAKLAYRAGEARIAEGTPVRVTWRMADAHLVGAKPPAAEDALAVPAVRGSA